MLKFVTASFITNWVTLSLVVLVASPLLGESNWSYRPSTSGMHDHRPSRVSQSLRQPAGVARGIPSVGVWPAAAVTDLPPSANSVEQLPPGDVRMYVVEPIPAQGDPYLGGSAGIEGEDSFEELPSELFDNVLEEYQQTSAPDCRPVGMFENWLYRRRLDKLSDKGLGPEHVARAPFAIDVTQPQNRIRSRFDSAFDWKYPDRAEYLWAKSPNGRGPGGQSSNYETAVNYQDFRFLFETGTNRFSMGTEIPIRMLNPEVNGNTAGMGDMSVTTKILMLDGKTWQISQVFRSYFNTGSVSHGTGNGHVSLEPGLLFRYRWSELTYSHAQIKYWIPLGADLNQGGQILEWGFGLSTVLCDNDYIAWLPTLEIVGWSVLDGQQTDPRLMKPVEADGENILAVFPGMRCVIDNGGDLGIFDLGISGGLSATETHWFDTLLRVDLQWSF